jgi:hypothetical protein
MRRLLTVSRSSGEISTVRISPIAMMSTNDGLAGGCAAGGCVAGGCVTGGCVAGGCVVDRLVGVVGVGLVSTVAAWPAVGPRLGTGARPCLRLATLVRSNRV